MAALWDVDCLYWHTKDAHGVDTADVAWVYGCLVLAVARGLANNEGAWNLRSSRKRKLVGPVKSLTVVVAAATKEKLDRIAGPVSLGATVETLIEREYARRERKSQQVQNSARNN